MSVELRACSRIRSVTGNADKTSGNDAGNAASWLERYGSALRQYFRRRIDAADVDDLVQDVMLKLQTSAIGSDVRGADRYLFTIARNVLIDRHRLQQTHDTEAYETYARIDGTRDRLSPERIVLARDEYAFVRRTIMNLPPRPRTAFELHRFENLTYPEIAAQMRISRETVKDLIERALTRIMLEASKAETGHD